MPRYFFDLEDHAIETDDEGTVLDDPVAARTEAVIFAGAFLRDNPQVLNDGYRFIVRVRDDAGANVVRIVIHAEDE